MFRCGVVAIFLQYSLWWRFVCQGVGGDDLGPVILENCRNFWGWDSAVWKGVGDVMTVRGLASEGHRLIILPLRDYLGRSDDLQTRTNIADLTSNCRGRRWNDRSRRHPREPP